MKILRVALPLLLVSGATLRAQQPPPSPGAPEGAAAFQSLRTAEELEQLLAPIALYPDALIALILPASVASTDVVLAARHLRDFPNDRSQIEHRAWDESVKSLTYYPEVLKWMDENLPWTKQVGEAFAEQPAEVMQAVQRLRARARAAGTLVDTPQQQVLAEPEVIRIVPAQPDVIYVPRYEPEIVFIHEPVYYTRPLLTFGVGVAAGSWLAYDCDWRRNTIWIGDRHRNWRGHDWRRPLLPPAPTVTHSLHGVHAWRPPARPRPVPHYTTPRAPTGIVRPSVIGTPPSQRTWPRTQFTTSRSPSSVHPANGPTPVPAATNRSNWTRPPGTARETIVPAPVYTSPQPSRATVVSSPAQPHLTTRGPDSVRERTSRPSIVTAPRSSPVQPVMGPLPPPNHPGTSASAPRLTTQPTAVPARRAAPAPVAPAATPANVPAPASAGEVNAPPPPQAVTPATRREAPRSWRGRENDTQR